MYLDYMPVAAISSFCFCLILIFLDKKAAKSGDVNLRDSPQTLHHKSVSRFGGVAIILSLTLASFLAGYSWNNSFYFQVGILSLPAFFVGFLDDFKILIQPWKRLLLLIPIPIIYFYYFDLKITNLDIGFLDNFLKFELFALLFICFSIVGMINAFNLIDGINGLLVSYLLSILFALILVENAVGPIFDIADEFRIYTNMLLGALIGFLILNYPFGKIFMGDAGAYYLGALVCFGLIHAHLENNSSPWVVMCLLSYPFTDLFFSVVRKKFILGTKAMQPDAEHLHHVIFLRLNELRFKHERAKHFFTVIFITLFNLPYLCLSLYFLNNSSVLIVIFAAYIVSYLLIYFSLSPRFLLRDEK